MLCFSVSTANADCGKSGDNEGSGFKIERGPNGETIFVQQSAITVCGTVPRPNVSFIFSNTSINYEWENLKRDFLPKVINAVKKAPF